MDFVFHDGGRAAAGYKGKTGDCVARSIAIATGKPYQEVYEALNQLAQAERSGRRKRKRSNSPHRRLSQDLPALSRIAGLAMDLNHVDWLRMPCSSTSVGAVAWSADRQGLAASHRSDRRRSLGHPQLLARRNALRVRLLFAVISQA